MRRWAASPRADLQAAGGERRDEEEMVPAQRVPQSHTACLWHPWHVLTSGTFSSKIPHNLSSRSKEDIAPWLAPGPELTPAIKNLLCASGSSRGSLAPGTDRHSWAQARGGFGSHGDRGITKTVHLASCKQLQRRKEQKCLWNVSLMTWMWSFLPDSNILTYQQQRGGVPSLG